MFGTSCKLSRLWLCLVQSFWRKVGSQCEPLLHAETLPTCDGGLFASSASVLRSTKLTMKASLNYALLRPNVEFCIDGTPFTFGSC